MECPIYSIKFLGVYYTSLDNGREDADYFTLTEEVFPDGEPFMIGGNSIGAKTLDLNQDFSHISEQLDAIAYRYFP